MKESYLPKLAVALLVLGVAVVLVSSQAGHVAATPTSPQGCYAYAGGYYYNYTYWYNYGYPYYYYSYNYPYYYCTYYYGYSYYGYPYSNYYYGYPYYYSYYSYYTPTSQYQLTVSTDPASLGTVSGGGTYTQGASASFSVTKNVIQVDQNTRYVFAHWSGDYQGLGSSGTITMNSAAKVIAVYQMQYYLNVNAQPQSAPSPQNTGWYNAGDTVSLSVPSQMIGGDDGSRLVFQGWSVDGSSPQPQASLTLSMDSPHTVTAQYKQQYYLKVLSDQGVAYGEGWYDAGTTAQIYVSTPASTTYGVSIIFNGWQGGVQSSNQAASVVMDGPKTTIASWRTDDTVLNWTIALGVLAAFLIAGGVVAYVVLNRNRFRQQLVKPLPTHPGLAAPTQDATVAKKKALPPKKKSVPENTDTATPTN
jgi:hypothetical protein